MTNPDTPAAGEAGTPSSRKGTMTERVFLQQLFLLKLDMEGNHMVDVVEPSCERFAQRLGDLLARRAEAL